MTDVAFPLATTTWDDKERAAMERVIRSGHFTMGAEVAAFERQFASMLGAKHALMVNSGSSANLIMIAALRYHSRYKLMPGDEVIVPAVSWGTTYYPLHQYGLRMKFVDIDANTLNFDLDRLAEAVGPSTKAVLAVNLLGNPNDFAGIARILRGRDILLLEDNCESLGASFDGRQAGTFGLAGSHSAFFSHHISTMEGGIVVTDDEELQHVMLSLRAHGWTRNLPEKNFVTQTKSADPFVESFRFVLPGYNLRPLELSGAIGQEQLRKLPALVAERRRNAARFLDLVADFPQLSAQQEIGESSWFGFSLVLGPDAPIDRPALIASLRRHGVECRPIVAGNFARSEVVAHMEHVVHGSLANADRVDRHGLFVGNHHYPLDRELAVLRSALEEAFA